MTVVHLINASLDGRCGHRNVIPDDDLHAHALSTIADADFLLFGAGTYRLLAEHWAQVAEEQSLGLRVPSIDDWTCTLGCVETTRPGRGCRALMPRCALARKDMLLKWGTRRGPCL